MKPERVLFHFLLLLYYSQYRYAYTPITLQNSHTLIYWTSYRITYKSADYILFFFVFSILRSETLEFLCVVTGCCHLRGVIRISRSLPSTAFSSISLNWTNLSFSHPSTKSHENSRTITGAKAMDCSMSSRWPLFYGRLLVSHRTGSGLSANDKIGNPHMSCSSQHRHSLTDLKASCRK